MNDTQKMFQMIMNNLAAFKQEVISKIDKLDKKLSGRVDGLDGKIDKVEKNLAGRIDKLGRQLAYLEDDAPTREEFSKLEKRVDKIEKNQSSNINFSLELQEYLKFC